MDLGLVEIIVAVFVAAVSYFGGRATERRNYRLSATGFVSHYFRDLRGWASEAIDVLCESIYCAPGQPDETAMNTDVCLRCRYRMSGLIDRGRFFIPNFNPSGHGVEKPAAYRGIRHPALDLLVAAEQLLGNPDMAKEMDFPSQRAALVDVKRAFVSEIQEILDPRTQNKHLAALLRETRYHSEDKRTALERLSDHRQRTGTQDACGK